MRRPVLILPALALTGALAACDVSEPGDLPLPGAAGGGGYTVTMTFDDATNLVPAETCRSNDTVVGSVVSVDLDARLHARVVCRIDPSVRLPANVEATLRETSLLGERYVGLDVPTGTSPQGRLDGGAVIPESSTSVQPDTEVVLGALSQVLNGGSLGSLATISRELSTALDGRTAQTRSAAERLQQVIGDLDAHRDGIVAALTSLGDLSQTLARQRQVLATTLQELPAGLAVLDRQRPALTQALRRVARLSRVLVPLVQRSRANTVADLHHLKPVLGGLSRSGKELALSLERLSSFPFNSNTLYTIKGDYSGAYIQANFDLDTVLALLASVTGQSGGTGTGSSTGTGTETLPLPGVPGLPTIPLPSLPTLPTLPTVPPVPTVPGLPGGVLGSRLTVVRAEHPTTLADLMTGPR